MMNTLKKEIHNRYNYMKRRCCDENYIGYKNYGGRNIKICNEWLNQERF